MNIKKALAVCASLAAALSLGACGGGASTAGGEKAEGDTFTIGFDANFPPYGYKEGDEFTGFDLDLAQEVAHRNGWEYKPQPIDWDSKDMELDSGTIDCIWNGFTMNGREDAYTWSNPYVDNSIVVITTADSKIEELSDLANKTVLVQADSSGLAALQDEANAELVESFAALEQVPDYNNAFMTLIAGGADAVVVDRGVGEYQIEQREANTFKTLSEAVTTEKYGVGFKLGNEALRDQVQASLNAMIDDGTFMEIATKWGLENSVITNQK